MSSNPQSAKKKVGLNSVISWGASVVIIGLMFKILHLQGGEIMIAVGLCTEAFLFAILGFASMAVEDTSTGDVRDKDGSTLTDLLATSITPKVIEGLSNGFKQFNTTVGQLNTTVSSFNGAQALSQQIEGASADVKKFRDNMGTVASGFSDFNKSLTAMGQMSASSQAMLKDFETAGQGMKTFAKNMTDMNSGFDQFTKTLTAINQMTASSASMLKEFEAATLGMRAYNKNLTDLTKVYQAQLDAFRKN